MQNNPLLIIYRRCGFGICLLGLAASLFVLPAPAQPVTYVIHISVDGLRADAVTTLGISNLPNFSRLRSQGAFTDNARTDYDYSITLPNHTSQLTGRGVNGITGHNWTANSDPAPGETLASHKGSYIAGSFDVVHDNGLKTGEFASKSKFSLYATSWNTTNGQPDVIGADNGRNKIDVYVNNTDTSALMNTFLTSISNQPLNYVFLHLANPDTAGHNSGWTLTAGSAYSNAVKSVDVLLGKIFNLLDTDSRFNGHTAIILTADHGGTNTDHSNATLPENFTIPFYVWGPGVMAGADLYALNPTNRQSPGTSRPDYSVVPQPIRNGDAANLALKLLGLGPVPGSTIGSSQNLALTLSPPVNFRAFFVGTNAALTFQTVSNVLYDIQTSTNLSTGQWSNLFTNLAGNGASLTNIDLQNTAWPFCYYRLRLHF